MFFESSSLKPSEIGTLFVFFSLNNNLSTEPCQLPVTEIINFFFEIAFVILNALVIASLPVEQNINFGYSLNILLNKFEKLFA